MCLADAAIWASRRSGKRQWQYLRHCLTSVRVSLGVLDIHHVIFEGVPKLTEGAAERLTIVHGDTAKTIFDVKLEPFEIITFVEGDWMRVLEPWSSPHSTRISHQEVLYGPKKN